MNRNRKIARKYFENREKEKKAAAERVAKAIPQRHPIKDANMQK